MFLIKTTVQFALAIIQNQPMLESESMNTEVSFADWTYKVTGVTTQGSAGNRAANGQYVVVTFDTTNNGNQARQPGAEEFYVLFDSSTGKVYKMDTSATLDDRNADIMANLRHYQHEPWILDPVNPGVSVKDLKVFFEVPADIDISQLKFLPKKGFGKVAPISLAQ